MSACTVVTVTALQLNVRVAPNATSKIIGKLQKDETVCAYAQNGNWAQVDQGWVSSRYLVGAQQQSYPSNPNNTMHAKGASKHSQYAGPNSNNMTVSGKTSPVKSDMTGEIATSIIVVMIAIYLIMLMVGMAGKVVVYYDEADLVISLMPWFILFVTVILAGIYQPTEQDLDPEKMLQIQRYVWYGGGILSILFSLWSILLSIKYNKSIVLGLLYGIFKLLSGLIGVLVLISQVFTMKDEKTKRKDFWFAILVFGAFWWLGKKLINGKKVYREKGWSLPT
jgi:hypothetical protein